MTSPYDVVIVGGGPAGAAAAIRLATAGHRVLVVTARDHVRVSESISPTGLQLLDALDARSEVERGQSFQPRKALVHWAGRRRAAPEAGYVIDRRTFDQSLQAVAQRVGVDWREQSIAGLPRRRDRLWQVPIGHELIQASFMIDASGRKGWLPGRRVRIGPPLIAIVATAEAKHGNGPDSVVEAAAHGWYWGARSSTGVWTVAAFIDPQQNCSRRPNQRCSVFEGAELLRTHIGELLSTPRICTAAPTTSADPAGDGWLKTGEAALALDPLSAQGVCAALAGGMLAATAADASLGKAGREFDSHTFYRSRILEYAARHRQRASAHYAAQAAVCGTPFWLDRAQAFGA